MEKVSEFVLKSEDRWVHSEYQSEEEGLEDLVGQAGLGSCSYGSGARLKAVD